MPVVFPGIPLKMLLSDVSMKAWWTVGLQKLAVLSDMVIMRRLPEAIIREQSADWETDWGYLARAAVSRVWPRAEALADAIIPDIFAETERLEWPAAS